MKRWKVSKELVINTVRQYPKITERALAHYLGISNSTAQRWGKKAREILANERTVAGQAIRATEQMAELAERAKRAKRAAERVAEQIAKSQVGKQVPEPQKTEPTSEEIADALLARCVEITTSADRLQGEILGWQRRCLDLEAEVAKAKAETERILKIHNEQVRRRNITDTAELKRLARIGGK